MIEVLLLNEAGYEEALEGVRLNFNADSERMPAVCAALSRKDRGHDKFLRMIITWFIVRGPRDFFQELDTYRFGVEKNSQSTMHTLLKRPLCQEDFILRLPDEYLDLLNHVILVEKDLYKAKKMLPEGFLQTRIYMMSYAAIKNIIIQRHNHRLPEWQVFVSEMYKQVKHPDLLPQGIINEKPAA